MAHSFILLPIALIPAALALITGRRLIDLADDPALPERLHANRGRHALVCTLCLAVMLPFGTIHFAWAAAVLVTARMAVGYWIRKALYRDTWRFGGYVSFFGRLTVAGFGFWAALALTPAIAMMAGRRDWMVAGALAAVLAVWGTAYGRLFSMVLRARPVDDPAILSRFAQLAGQCGLRNVALRQVDTRGGVFANAVALPSVAHPIVLVSSTLVERLDADETTAILAHELAHIEHYSPRVLRRASLIMYGLIAAGALVAPATRVLPESRDALFVLWPVALITSLVLRARHRQKHETESDLRALALTGNPDALVRALTKLHAFARMPRRWDLDTEKRATHPSLARRIHAIHAAAGISPAPLGTSAVFVSADGGRSVAFHDDRVEFNEGAAGCHAIGYGLLTTLRVEVKSAGAPRLVAVDGSSRRWDVRLQPCDVGRAQAALDAVDGRLAAAATPPQVPSAVGAWLALATMLTAGAAGQFSVSLVAWLGLVKPGSPLLAAVGAAAVGAAAVVWRDHFAWAADAHAWSALALLVYGIVLITLRALNRQDDDATMRTRRLTALLAVAALIAGSLVAASGLDAMSLHRSAREWPSAGILALSLAGALAFARSPRVRYTAVPAACTGVAVIFLGSAAFLDRFVADGFLAPSPPLAVTTVSVPTLAEFAVPFDVTEMRLSPAGRFVALASENDEEQITIHAGPAGGSLVSFDADQAIFVDDARLLLLERQRSAAVLRLVDLEQSGRELWSKRLELGAVRLSFDRSTATWRLLGRNETDDVIRVSGRINDNEVREERWSAAGLEDADVLSVSNGAVLALETDYTPGRFAYRTFGRWAALMPSGARTESRFWSIERGRRSVVATSGLDVACRQIADEHDATVCAAFDGMTTRFFAVDPATRRPAVLASVSGRFYVRGDAGAGWFVGWWDRTAVLVKPSIREAIRMADSDRRGPTQLARAGNLLGAVFSNGRGSIVRLYSLERQN